MSDDTYVCYSGQAFKISIAYILDTEMSVLLSHCLDKAANPEKNNEPVSFVISAN